MKIAGVVVLYNPGFIVVNNINSYIEDIDLLYVIDNSDITNNEVILKLKQNKKIKYIKNKDNLGIGAALNIAAKLAIVEKYDYLLTMDQDSSAEPNMIKKMLNDYGAIENIGIISPVHINKFNTQKVNDEKITEKFDVMASGNLVSLDAYAKVGGFNEEYFIDYVDIEFCLRMHLNNFKIIQVNRAKLFHEEANITKSKLFGKVFYPYNHSSERLYYKTRNRLYLRKKYYKSFREYFLTKERKVYIRTLLKIFLFEKYKLKKIKMIINGYIDFYKGKTGRLT